MAQENQGNQGFIIPPANSPEPGGQSDTTPSQSQPPEIPSTDAGITDVSGQAYAIAGVILLVWVIAAFLFRRKWALSFKEKRVSESNAEASGWAFFGALVSLGVGAIAAFFDKFAALIYLGPILGVSIVLFVIAFVMARK